MVLNILALNGQTKMNDIGIECGPGLSIIHDKTGMYSHSGFWTGGVSGIFYQYNLSNIFSLKTALFYERKGSLLASKSDQLPEDGNLIYNFDYINLPLLFKVSIGHRIKFFANSGPCFSYLMNQSVFFQPKTGKSYKLLNETNDFKSYDVGIILGLGVTIPVTKQFIISLEMRDTYGLVSIRDNYNEPDSFGYITSDAVPKMDAYANSTSIIFGFAYRFSTKRP